MMQASISNNIGTTSLTHSLISEKLVGLQGRIKEKLPL
jgi:hypothetical protein